MINTGAMLSVFLLACGQISQLLKQFWLAEIFLPNTFALVGMGFLASQLFYSFGSFGFQNYSARTSVRIGAKQELLMMEDLVKRQLVLYLILSPITLCTIYIALSKPSLISFAVIIVYAASNVFLNTVTIPIYVRNHTQFSSIQAVRSVGALGLAYLVASVSSIEAILIMESILLVGLGLLLRCKQRPKLKIIRRKYLPSLKNNLRMLFPYFLPVALAATGMAYTRVVAGNLLTHEQLGIYYFLFITVSIGTFLQYSASVIMGPMVTQALHLGTELVARRLVVKLWAICFAMSVLAAVIVFYSASFIVEAAYPEYVDGLVLLNAFLVLIIAKGSDVWSVYFLLCGHQKYISITHLGVIVLLVLVSSGLVDSQRQGLAVMNLLIYAEAAALLVIPIFAFFWLNKREATSRPDDA